MDVLPDSPPIERAGFDRRLTPIIDKVERGERLTLNDGALLYETPDIWTVCALADRVRRRMHGEIAYYNINRHINYTNICALSCKFCAFHRKRDQSGAYEFSLDEIREEAVNAAAAGATELHIVGGLHPWLPFEYYTNMLRTLREAVPRVHIKAFTAVEIVHLARISKRAREGYEGIKAVLSDLKDAGLGSLPGGGAEVFDDRVHDEAFKGKIRSDKWLDVHKAAHELGLNSNATMLYGHIDQRRERLVHMEILRRAQDIALHRLGYAPEEGTETSRQQGMDEVPAMLSDWPGPVVLTGPGAKLPTAPTSESLCSSSPDATAPTAEGGFFQTIIPLPFFPDESEMEHLPAPTGLENLRTLAICRLMLDNFPHVKAFWIMQTLEMAQFMLQNGADDIDGTVVWYDITKLEGPTTHQEASVWDLQRAIRDAGFRPVERDTLYRPIDRDPDGAWRVAKLAGAAAR